MTESVLIHVQDASQTAVARRVAQKMAGEIGFLENRTEEVSIVVTEACTNLVKHGEQGMILLRRYHPEDPQESAGLEMLALDKGPGMANLEQCLRDGFSTAGSPGQGLGAIVRLSDTSDFYSLTEKGTIVLARWAATRVQIPSPLACSSALQIGVVNVPKPGEEVCGDAWGVEQNEDQTVILLADGLGHGPEARRASVEAVRTLHSDTTASPKALIERIHGALRSTRGAAVAVVRIDRCQETVCFSGVGNISTQIYSDSKAGQHLVSVNGTAGHQMHRLREFSYPWPRRGILVLHSDGLSTDASLEGYPGLTLRDASLIAGTLYRDFNRGCDDSTVVVAKGV